MEGIDRLRKRDVKLSLKSMAITLNHHEISEMKALAVQMGVHFRFDTMLNRGLDGSDTPTGYRLSPSEVLELDLQDPDRMKGWEEVVEKFPGGSAGHDRVYQCGAGKSTFHIDPTGKLSVCMMSRSENYDLRTGTFREGWRAFIPAVLSREWTGDVPCRECTLKSMCGQCPGWGLLEHGDPELIVNYLCEIAHSRARMLGLISETAYDISSSTGAER